MPGEFDARLVQRLFIDGSGYCSVHLFAHCQRNGFLHILKRGPAADGRNFSELKILHIHIIHAQHINGPMRILPLSWFIDHLNLQSGSTDSDRLPDNLRITDHKRPGVSINFRIAQGHDRYFGSDSGRITSTDGKNGFHWFLCISSIPCFFSLIWTNRSRSVLRVPSHS